MLKSPFDYESEFSAEELQKIGALSLRWSHIDHIIGNCLRVMLRLSDEEPLRGFTGRVDDVTFVPGARPAQWQIVMAEIDGKPRRRA